MSIAKNASYNLIGSLIPLVVSLVTVPLYLHAIGLERYGVLALCWTLLGYMGFLNLGLGPSVAQKMATLRKTDGAERESVFWTSLWVSLAMGLVAGLVVYGAADAYFTRMKDLPVGLSREIADARAWLAAIIPVILLSSVLTGALQGHERFLAINVITSSMSILMSVAPLAVAYVFGPHLSGLLAAALAVRVGSLLALYLMCRSTIPIRQVRRLELSHVRNLLTFGGWVTASAVMAPLLVTFDRFVIGAMLGAAAVSIYTIPHNLVGRLFVIPKHFLTLCFLASPMPKGGRGSSSLPTRLRRLHRFRLQFLCLRSPHWGHSLIFGSAPSFPATQRLLPMSSRQVHGRMGWRDFHMRSFKERAARILLQSCYSPI